MILLPFPFVVSPFRVTVLVQAGGKAMAGRANLLFALLIAACSVTKIMVESGVETKSNVNREVLRVTGVSPTAWRQARRDLAQDQGCAAR